MTPFWGKLVGTVAGLATGQPWIALVGLVLGHQFDRGYAEKADGGASDDTADRRIVLPEYFLRALFQSMGHLAKADGRVSEAEIRAARTLMHRLDLDPAKVRRAIECFEAGKAPSFPLQLTIRRLYRDTARQPSLRMLFVRLLIEVAVSKGSMDARERALLWTVCRELGIGRVQVAQLEALLRAQRAFRPAAGAEVDTARVSSAYAILGVDQSSSNEDIKRAYRRLMNRYHPDKIAASDPGPDAIAEAQKKTRDIRNAYETLKTRRLIR